MTIGAIRRWHADDHVAAPDLLDHLASDLTLDFGVQCGAIVSNFSVDGTVSNVTKQMLDLDIRLVISNAGAASRAGSLNSISSVTRTAGGSTTCLISNLPTASALLWQSAAGAASCSSRGLGAERAIPLMANACGAKSYVQKLGESLHVEFKALGAHVTVALPGPTDTPTMQRFGFTAESMPLKPMATLQCGTETLHAQERSKSVVIS
ncbi:MAG TPA: hypothetical protein VK824_09305, partial [Planctomycetota bacterium]|nr:hypothetical protein [Planctomycetota bacterium]